MKNTKSVLLFVLTSFVFTFILGFIDEGYYNLQTFKNIGNILVLALYAIVFWCAQLGAFALLKKVSAIHKTWQVGWAIILGLFVPITLIMICFN